MPSINSFGMIGKIKTLCDFCKIDDFYIATRDFNCEWQLFKELIVKSHAYENTTDLWYF